MDQKTLRYQKHLDGVSRSFAFCIQQLQGDFRHHVSLAYLLFRVLDCVEDFEWSDKSAQDRSFQDFNSFLVALPTAEQLNSWRNSFSNSGSESEKLLLADAHSLFVDLHTLSMDEKTIFQKHLLNMSRGMQYFSRHKIETLSQLNSYCFFVAGLIGEFLSEIYAADYGQIFSKRDLVNATHFGLFLQKINILKDQKTDEKEGREWIVERDQLTRELAYNSLRAFDYLRRIQSQRDGYKIFCAWCLFLGLASYPYIIKGWNQPRSYKIPRLKTKLLIFSVKRMIVKGQAEKLEALFDKLMKQLPAPQNPPTHSIPSRVFEMYSGELSAEDLTQFNMNL